MSAFFLAINRDESIFEQSVAENMMTALDDFGCDQTRLIVKDNYALGYQSLWTVPEELNEYQPLLDEQGDGAWFMLYGRIDNRSDLLKRLEACGQSGLEQISDAELLYCFYKQFGKNSLADIIGPFVFVVFSPQTETVLAARDGMGGRNLVYRITEQHILIATYEMALVAHPSVAYRLNQSRVARVIGRLIEDVLTSPIMGLTPLKPGEMLTLSISKQTEPIKEFFYQFDGSTRVTLADDQAYATRFKELLTQSVERRSRAIGPIGTMLSGGFDSVPISILLAQSLQKKEQSLTAFSWVFDKFKEVDERLYSSEICQRYNIEHVCINCDNVWPKFDDSTYVNPVMPFSIPYVELQQAALNSAKQRDVRTVFSGVHGDLLYSYTDGILWELFKAGHWKCCVTEAIQRYKGSSNFITWFKQYVLRPLPLVARLLEKKRLKTKPQSELLTDKVLALLENNTSSIDKQAVKSLRPIGYKLVFGGFAGEDIAYGRHIDAQSNVERRYPFRDRDLCEFMLSIPSKQLHFDSVPRPIVRKAFKTELTSGILARKSKTSFYPAIQSGIESDPNYHKWFDKPDANWQNYVKKCYFYGQSDKKSDLGIVRWQCGYYDYWISVCYNKEVIKLGLSNEYA